MNASEIEKYIKKNSLRTNLKYYAGVVVSFITIAVFAGGAFGAIQLFLFANNYNIAFNDLLSSGYFFSYGVIYLIFFTVVLIPLIVMAGLNYSLFEATYEIMVEKSKIVTIKNNGLFFYIVCQTVFNSWPLMLILPHKLFNYAFLIHLVTCITLVFVYISFGVQLKDNKWTSRLSSFIPAYISFITIFAFGFILFYFILIVEFRHLKNMQTSVVMPIAFICLMIIIIVSDGMAYYLKRKKHYHLHG